MGRVIRREREVEEVRARGRDGGRRRERWEEERVRLWSSIWV